MSKNSCLSEGDGSFEGDEYRMAKTVISLVSVPYFLMSDVGRVYSVTFEPIENEECHSKKPRLNAPSGIDICGCLSDLEVCLETVRGQDPNFKYAGERLDPAMLAYAQDMNGFTGFEYPSDEKRG